MTKQHYIVNVEGEAFEGDTREEVVRLYSIREEERRAERLRLIRSCPILHDAFYGFTVEEIRKRHPHLFIRYERGDA